MYTKPQLKQEKQDNYDKLGGWLIFVALGLILAPVMLFLTSSEIARIFATGSWSLLVTPGSEYYNSLNAPIIIFDTVCNTILFIYSIVNLVYFFRRKKLFPKLIIFFYVINLIFIFVDYYLNSLLPAVKADPSLQSYDDLIRAVINAAIWIPYFIKSKRVKATFVK
jgi:hypothetical protein